jgi:hypothetical protein
MPVWLVALITGIGGALLGVAGAAWLSSRAYERDRRTEMRAAYAIYLGAFSDAFAEIREPPSAPRPRDAPLDRAVDRLIAMGKSSSVSFVSDLATRRGATRSLSTRRRAKETAGALPEGSTRLTSATALLEVLPLPDEARAAVERANDYLIRLEMDRSPTALGEYSDVYEQLRAAGRSIEDG